MISTKSLPGLKEKVFSKLRPQKTSSSAISQGSSLFLNREPLEFDLISQLTHMSAVSTAGIGRAQLFQGISALHYSTSRYFKQVHQVAQRLNYDYSAACEMVAEVTKVDSIRNLLLRFSTALSAGESEEVFLKRETEVELELYGKKYERDMESLRKWTDAYVALMVSAVLVVVVSLVSMMIYSFGSMGIIGMAVLIVFVCFTGGGVIWSVSPREVKTHKLKFRSPGMRQAEEMARLLFPAAGLAGAAMGLLAGLGPALMASSVLLIPVGVAAMKEDWRIDARDRDISSFLRALGGILGTVNTTVTDGLSRLNRQALGSLEPHVKRLYGRLRNNISPDLCWRRFAAESGSELVNRSVQIFWDGLRLGGDPGRVGYLASIYSLKIALMRATRRMIASTFTWVSIPLHAVLLGVMLFITEVVQIFGTKLSEVQSTAMEGGVAQEAGVSTVLMFGAPDMGFVKIFVAVVIIMLTFANSFAPYAAGGGHPYKMCIYGPIMMFMSGLALITVPELVQVLFETVTAGTTVMGGAQ